MITGLDHVAYVVRDLDAAVDGYTRLFGVTPEWVGRGGGVRQAWFQFPNMALDLIAPEGEGPFADGVRAQLDASGEGLWALAFTTDDIAGDVKLMNRRGVPASGPAPVSTTADDGRVREWVGARLDPKATGGLRILLMAASAQPWPLATPAGDAPITELDHVVVVTPNVDRALAIYGAKLGLDLRLDRENPKWDARQLFFKVGGTVIEIGAKIGAAPTDAPDRSGGLAWRVAEPQAAQARIAAAGFEVSEVRAGRKPGTHVFTVRDAPAGVPTILLSAEPVLETA
ncbi:MAG: VOC family protein [Alphaproteobacteria bacterium]|nr:VOC family protein [Alphaproteobacteria bacterium]MBU1514904.1 VOC family protein [Alphaproteobacteria bacterium]MBU2093825.1 VOC family protein [Alphaproteobacteria bacterium]MBU2154081.1 VOC family protein [Alphaproteobacteria bacterium]MBU2305406.1 VOC family protein [Alphaproteobacteria bacterium]